MCEARKALYRSRRAALRVAGRRFREDGEVLRVYRCGDHWHLTSMTRTEFDARWRAEQ